MKMNKRRSNWKTFFLRGGMVLLAMAAGVGIFLLLTWTGQKNEGPLDELLRRVDFRISQAEKNILNRDLRERRAWKLNWFQPYRMDIASFNAIDTILLGAYDDNTVESYESIMTLEDSIQCDLPIISIYTAWGSKKNQVFPFLRMHAITDLGSIPMITWEPWLDDFNPQDFPVMQNKLIKNLHGMKEIAEGKFDDYIDKWAKDAARFGQPFLLRFGHEMNDPYRYPWGPQNNKPEDFIAAWHHVRQRFKKAGAVNVIWVWSPHPAYTTYPQYYPGHDVVDWIGVTTLNYGTVAPWSQWWTFHEIFGKFYDSVSLYNKPIIITEFASLPIGGDRPQWYQDALFNMPEKYPAVKALVLFHARSDNTTTYKSIDWSFENDKATTEAFKKAIHNWKNLKNQDRK